MRDEERQLVVDDAKEIAIIRLKRKQPTHSDVKAVARASLEEALPDYTQEELSRIVTEIETNISVKVQEPDILVDEASQSNWFLKAKSSTKTYYFDRYIRYLRTQSFPEPVLSQMGNDTRRVLALSANPFAVKDSKRGLVVGDVQSGKTANYLALINLACDFGYKIVVLLAGMTDSLREQTQDRIDFGFIGAMSDSIGGGIEYVGVGLEKTEHFAVPLTNTRQDFVKWIKQNINATPSEYTKPLVLVVKKNKGVLEHVNNWLKSKSIRNLNILIIDDEADNASINSKRDDNDPTQINRKIRELFTSFKVATYVGFTATPFANIFINPADDEDLKSLFPSDFIVQLKTPSNYCGAHWFFDEDAEHSRLRFLDESEENFLPAIHKKDATFFFLPESMKEAVLSFVLGCAVRTMRGQGSKHRSMLVNISRFNNLQYEIKSKITDFVEGLQDIIQQETYKDLEDYLRHPVLKRLSDLYENSPTFAKAREEFAFETLRLTIKDESKLLEVAVLNNRIRQEERFSYKEHRKGARVIAIGGFLLSRGLTLEGLMVSYYSRNTATYDSLLQMGRWFGYRFGYDDLCVLYISRINVENFRAVISAVDDLKEQFSEMRATNKPPREFGLMVKCSPDTLETNLLVTSRNKMFHSQKIEYWISYGGTVADTSKLYKDSMKNAANERASLEFFKQLFDDGFSFVSMGSRKVVQNVPKAHIAKFIASLDIPFENRKFDPDTLAAYIAESRVFPKWDLTIATGSETSMKWVVNGLAFDAAIRSCEIRKEEDFIRVGMGNNRLIEPSIFAAGLTDNQLQQIKSEKKHKMTYADYLKVEGRNPLLVFYPLALKTGAGLVNESPYIGFAVGFPSRGRAERAKYQANEVKIREMAKNTDDFDDDEESVEEA